MDSLQEDVRRYLRVYRRNVSDVLQMTGLVSRISISCAAVKASLTELLANQDH